MTPYRDRLHAGHYANPNAAPDPADLTVEQLKEKLRERDLPVSGSKDELLARLNEGE